MPKEEFRVQKIREGTVIDHISAGIALAVLRILGITGREDYIVSVLMNVPSKALRRKDIVKIEGREISSGEADKIALVAPQATINIIRDYRVVKKEKVKLVDEIKGILKCPNPTCVTNTREPVKASFHVERKGQVLIRCYYCGTTLEEEDIIKQF
jgi:aspartate carbamoyltransferase regulatory subunit